MELKEAFGATLRQARLRKGLTQEHFSLVSSRTNVSLLERGGTSPTLIKLEELCRVLDVHPVSLVAACYMRKESITDLEALLAHVRKDLKAIDS
ncbi:UNVERIFIED_ORG: transcriptional regulator with XRE-family HTH domain [Pseudomonas mohnii]|nr:transcriptional regulator with XRE-family HTH domain [Pseudomonas mohnii]